MEWLGKSKENVSKMLEGSEGFKRNVINKLGLRVNERLVLETILLLKQKLLDNRWVETSKFMVPDALISRSKWNAENGHR